MNKLNPAASLRFLWLLRFLRQLYYIMSQQHSGKSGSVAVRPLVWFIYSFACVRACVPQLV